MICQCCRFLQHFGATSLDRQHGKLIMRPPHCIYEDAGDVDGGDDLDDDHDGDDDGDVEDDDDDDGDNDDIL